MKKVLNNERGNIAIFVLGLLIINMVLFVFVLNLGSVFATKEKSASISQQASMVATSVFYEEVRSAIGEYEEETLEGALHAFFEDFAEKVDERKRQLESSGRYVGWSVREIEVKAFDQVLNEELNSSDYRFELEGFLESRVDKQKVIRSVKSTIQKNDGLLEDAQLEIKNNRFHVKASKQFTATTYSNIIESFQDNVYQNSSGPKIDFLEEIWGNPRTINLEE